MTAPTGTHRGVTHLIDISKQELAELLGFPNCNVVTIEKSMTRADMFQIYVWDDRKDW